MNDIPQHPIAHSSMTPTLSTRRLTLRPLCETDWDMLFRWNRNPEILFLTEPGDVQTFSPQEVRETYYRVEQQGYCFIIEHEGLPVGECWLIKLAYDKIDPAYEKRDCRRIDLMIGEPQHWGKGLGVEAIGRLAEFAFVVEGVFAVFGCDIGSHNRRSLGAFKKVGFEVLSEMSEPPGRKASHTFDLILTREKFLGFLA